jgi:hypothetical protein
MIELLRHQREDGREPCTEWLDAVSDGAAQERLRVRLRQVQLGNFGDSEPVGEGVIRVAYPCRARIPRVLWPLRSIGRPASERRRQQFPGVGLGHQAGQGAGVGVETEANMSQLKGVVSHHEREIAELRADRELAVAYLKEAMDDLTQPGWIPQ